MTTEDRLVKSLTRALHSKGVGKDGAELRLGIGDDAAIIAPGRGLDCVVTCDAFLEGVHFLFRTDPADSVGFKSLARATSDLAAMGARPRFYFLTLALSKLATGHWLAQFVKGMRRASERLGVQIAGGDTSRDSKVAISISVLGEIASGRAILRSGARPGDLIFVTGRLGEAALGLELIRHGFGRDKRLRRLLQAHFYPQIQLELGEWLARHRVASSMMDISDGLSTDLSRLCATSRVGARIIAEHVPTVRRFSPQIQTHKNLRIDPMELALHGGDDYGLLFTVPQRSIEGLKRAPGFSALTRIGEIVSGGGISLVTADGKSQPLKPLGWDPFRKRS